MSQKQVPQVEPSHGGSLFPNLLKNQSNFDEAMIKPRNKSYFKPLIGFEDKSALESSPELCVRPRDKLYMAKKTAEAVQRLKSSRKKKKEKKRVVLSSFTDSDSDFEHLIQEAKTLTTEKGQVESQNRNLGKSNKNGMKQSSSDCKNTHQLTGITVNDSSSDLFSGDSDIEFIELGGPKKPLQQPLRKEDDNQGHNAIQVEETLCTTLLFSHNKPLSSNKNQYYTTNKGSNCEIQNPPHTDATAESDALLGSTKHDDAEILFSSLRSPSSSDLDEQEWEAAVMDIESPGKLPQKNHPLRNSLSGKQRKTMRLSNGSRSQRSEQTRSRSQEKQVELLDRIFFGEENISKKRSSSELCQSSSRPGGDIPKLKKPKVDNLCNWSGTRKNSLKKHGGSDELLELSDISLLDVSLPLKGNRSPIKPITIISQNNAESNCRQTRKAGSSVALKTDCVIASTSKGGNINKTYTIKPAAETMDSTNKNAYLKTSESKKERKSPAGSCSMARVGACVLPEELNPESAGIMGAGFTSALSVWKSIDQRATGGNGDCYMKHNADSGYGGRVTRASLNRKQKKENPASATVTSEQRSHETPETGATSLIATSAAVGANSNSTKADGKVLAKKTPKKRQSRDNPVADSANNNRQSLFDSDILLDMFPIRQTSTPKFDTETNGIRLSGAGGINGSNSSGSDPTNSGTNKNGGRHGNDDNNTSRNQSTSSSAGRRKKSRSGVNSTRGGPGLSKISAGVCGLEVICLDDTAAEAGGNTGVPSSLEHLESDEVMARRLQEEMDHEYAQQMQQNPTTPQAPNQPFNRQPAMTLRMMNSISQMSEYEWDVHKSLVLGQDLPERPPNEPVKELHEFVDNDVLELLASRSPDFVQFVENYEIPTENDETPGDSDEMPRGSNDELPRRNNPRRRLRPRRTELSQTETQDRIELQSSVMGQNSRAAPYRHLDRLTELLTQTPDRSRDEAALLPEIMEHLNSRQQHPNDVPPVVVPTHRHRGRRGEAAARRNRGNYNQGFSLFEGVMGPLSNPRRPSRNRGGYFQPFDTALNDYEGLLELGERLGEVRKTGLTDREIHRLPIKSFRRANTEISSATAASGTPPEECNICCCEFEDKEELRILPCFHNFHVTCIDQWISTNATCPVCRAEIKFS